MNKITEVLEIPELLILIYQFLGPIISCSVSSTSKLMKKTYDEAFGAEVMRLQLQTKDITSFIQKTQMMHHMIMASAKKLFSDLIMHIVGKNKLLTISNVKSIKLKNNMHGEGITKLFTPVRLDIEFSDLGVVDIWHYASNIINIVIHGVTSILKVDTDEKYDSGGDVRDRYSDACVNAEALYVLMQLYVLERMIHNEPKSSNIYIFETQVGMFSCKDFMIKYSNTIGLLTDSMNGFKELSNLCFKKR